MSFVDLSGQKKDVSTRQSNPLEPAIDRYLAERRGREVRILIWHTKITSGLSIPRIAKGLGMNRGHVGRVVHQVTAALKKISQEINLSAALSCGEND